LSAGCSSRAWRRRAATSSRRGCAGRDRRAHHGRRAEPFVALCFDGEDHWLLVGGEGHLTGSDEAQPARFEALEAFAREHFDVVDVPYRWSTQDGMPTDKLCVSQGWFRDQPGDIRPVVAEM